MKVGEIQEIIEADGKVSEFFVAKALWEIALQAALLNEHLGELTKLYRFALFSQGPPGVGGF